MLTNVKEYYQTLKNKNIQTHDNEIIKIFKLLKENIPFCLVRFNDGEMMAIDKIGCTVARNDQFVNESLHKALKHSIQHKQKNYIIGMPCKNCYPYYYNLACKMIKTEYTSNATVLTNNNWAYFITEIASVLKDKLIYYIGGSDQDISFLKEINVNISQVHLYPNKNTWDIYDKIKKDFRKNISNEKIILSSIGPTSRIFSQKMFVLYPHLTFLDIGSTFDPFTRNVWHNCHKGWIENGFNNTKICEVCNKK